MKYYRVIDKNIGNTVVFQPNCYAEKVVEWNGKHILQGSKYGGYIRSNIPETCASKTIGGAVMGNWTGSQMKVADTYYVYQIETIPDIDLSECECGDFNILQEVRFRTDVQAILVGQVKLTEEDVEVFNSYYDYFHNENIQSEEEFYEDIDVEQLYMIIDSKRNKILTDLNVVLNNISTRIK